MRYIKYYESLSYSETIRIHSICKEHRILDYTINSDGSIDVDGSVVMRNKGLFKLPLKFGRISGSFFCSDNYLTDLENFPRYVGGIFDCSFNKLESLNGCPIYVGSLDCNYNQITSLEGSPISFKGDFICINNPVYEIWKLFKDTSKIELFNDYDIVRGDSIVLDRLNEFLEVIGKPTIKNVKGYKNI